MRIVRFVPRRSAFLARCQQLLRGILVTDLPPEPTHLKPEMSEAQHAALDKLLSPLPDEWWPRGSDSKNCRGHFARELPMNSNRC